MNNNSKAQRRIAALQQLQRKINNVKANKPRQRKSAQKRKPARPNQRRLVGKGMYNNAYALCRLRPFNGIGRNTGIPDGSNIRRLLIDHRMITTLQFGPTGTISFLVVPAVPSPLWVQNTDAGIRINGGNFSTNAPNSALYVPVVLSEWVSLPLNWSATPNVINDAGTLFGSTKFRLVTLGYRISYLGTALSDSGMIRVSAASLSIETPVQNTGTVTVYSSQSGTNTNVTATETLISYVNAPFLGGPLAQYSSAETVAVPLRGGVEGALRHSAPDYEYKTVHANMNHLCNSQFEGFSMLQQQVPVPSNIGASAHVAGFDDTWDAAVVSITGGTASQSFMVDIIMCVEYVPQPDSGTYALAKAGPPENKPLMQRVDNALKKQPLASTIDSVSNLVGIAKAAGALVTALV